ncbi:hypothetical protein Golax_010581 [Gossypium laxum]|uniref:Uncharacterized protein n=1 Tax=Gossypium laxum TaxID=34288 RepID=A0A7J8ZIF9_9ROSI|nr:hypothetical protein [Gossypium laxum]
MANGVDPPTTPMQSLGPTKKRRCPHHCPFKLYQAIVTRGTAHGTTEKSSHFQSPSPYGIQTPSPWVMQTFMQFLFYQGGLSSKHPQPEQTQPQPEADSEQQQPQPKAEQRKNPVRDH